MRAGPVAVAAVDEFAPAADHIAVDQVPFHHSRDAAGAFGGEDGRAATSKEVEQGFRLWVLVVEITFAGFGCIWHRLCSSGAIVRQWSLDWSGDSVASVSFLG